MHNKNLSVSLFYVKPPKPYLRKVTSDFVSVEPIGETY